MAGYGQESQIGISFQDSFGTSQQDSIFWIPKLSENISKEIPQLVEQNLKGIFDEGAHYEGPHSINGPIETEANPVSVGVLLKCVMGEPATVNSDSLYTHTFKPRTSDWDSKAANVPVTIEKYLGVGSADLFYDMNGTSLTLSVTNGELMKGSVEFVGGSNSQQANSAASYPTNKLWSWDTSSVSIGGSGKSEIMDMTITLNEQLEAMHTLDATKTPSRIKRTGFRTVEVSGTLKFDNADEYQQFLDQSEREMIIHFEGVTAVQSGYNEALTITLPSLRWIEDKPAAGGPGEIEVGVTGKGVYNVGSATAMEVVLYNGQSGY